MKHVMQCRNVICQHRTKAVSRNLWLGRIGWASSKSHNDIDVLAHISLTDVNSIAQYGSATAMTATTSLRDDELKITFEHM